MRVEYCDFIVTWFMYECSEVFFSAVNETLRVDMFSQSITGFEAFLLRLAETKDMVKLLDGAGMKHLFGS